MEVRHIKIGGRYRTSFGTVTVVEKNNLPPEGEVFVEKDGKRQRVLPRYVYEEVK